MNDTLSSQPMIPFCYLWRDTQVCRFTFYSLSYCLWPCQEHRLNKFFQMSWSWASCSSCPHVWPFLLKSGYRSHNRCFLVGPSSSSLKSSRWGLAFVMLSVQSTATIFEGCHLPRVGVLFIATVLRCWSCLANGSWGSFWGRCWWKTWILFMVVLVVFQVSAP